VVPHPKIGSLFYAKFHKNPHEPMHRTIYSYEYCGEFFHFGGVCGIFQPETKHEEENP
jgi:hypothetical protein